MAHYSISDRRIISSIIKGLVFLIKGREILDLAVEFKVRFYLTTKITFILEPISIRSK